MIPTKLSRHGARAQSTRAATVGWAIALSFALATLHSDAFLSSAHAQSGAISAADAVEYAPPPAPRQFADAANSCDLLSCGGQDQPATANKKPQREFNPRTVLGRAIRPIVNAPQIPAAKVKDQVSDNDLVLGVVVDGKARAYPINLLCGPAREIVNDQVGEQAIAATW